MTAVTLKFGATSYTVYCNNVAVGWKNNNSGKPYVDNTTPYEVQTNTFDNPTYSIQGVQLVGSTGSLTYAALLSMSKSKYIGTNPIYLKFYIGMDGTITQVPDSTGTTGTDGIKVILDSWNMNVVHQESAEGKIPTLTLTFRETA
jgi:hypothetical protein